MPRPPLNKVPLRKWNRPFKSSQTTDIVRACFLFNSFRLNRIVRQGQEVRSAFAALLVVYVYMGSKYKGCLGSHALAQAS